MTLNLPPYPNNPDADWKGLTLREMQMRRTLVQAKMEIEKFKLSAGIDSCKSRTPIFGGSSSLFSRITGAISVAEYAYLALRAVRMLAPLFRRRK